MVICPLIFPCFIPFQVLIITPMQADPLSAENHGSTRPASRPGGPLMSVRDLSCTRNDVPVFGDIAFSLFPGQVLLIEGENGSGKTTLLRVLCGLLEPETGEVLWQGGNIRLDYSAYLREIWYVGHGNGIKLGLTPLENLAFSRDLSAAGSSADLADILKRFGLGRVYDVPAQYLSAGQRRRLALARLLLDRRPVWILDEPFTSLDEHGRRMLRELFSDHLDRNGAVIMTSHDAFSWNEASLQRLSLS